MGSHPGGWLFCGVSLVGARGGMAAFVIHSFIHSPSPSAGSADRTGSRCTGCPHARTSPVAATMQGEGVLHRDIDPAAARLRTDIRERPTLFIGCSALISSNREPWTGLPFGISAPLDTHQRQRLEYSGRAFQAGNRPRAFERGYQCSGGGGSARGSETARSKVLRNNFGGLNKSARYPLGELGVERGQLIRQILHQTSILEIRGDHFSRECPENLMNKIQGVTRRTRRDVS
ncbi:hypothetical protein CH72_6595 [Burkholderia ambifaria AMMD]|nr:hypothetical protein CH72_6595 [Burkholderia ambifaria AMMD]